MPKSSKRAKPLRNKELLRLVIEYFHSLFAVSVELTAKQLQTINKYERHVEIFQERSSQANFWPDVLKGLDADESGNIFYTLSQIRNVGETLQNLAIMTRKERNTVVQDMTDLVSRLKRADEALSE